MGALTLADYRARVYDKLGLPTTDGHVTTAQVNAALNAALQEYATEYDWPWLQSEATITTVAGTQTYALPARYTRTLYLIDGDGQGELEYRPRRQLAAYEGETGRARFYSGLVGTVALYPEPNDAVTLTHGYVISEAEMDDDADTILLPDAYADFLVTIAARKIALRRKDTELKRLLDEEHTQWLGRIRNEQRRTMFLGGVKAIDRGV